MDKKRRILIASSDEVNREFFEIMFENLGFDVNLSLDGEDVFNILRKERPDIMILDSIMPVMTGWEVTKHIKKDPKFAEFSDIPIIMLSELDNPQDIVEGFDLGVEDYIRKPFSFAVVFARVKAALRNRELMCRKLHGDEVISVIKTLNNTMEFLREHLELPIKELDSAVDECELADFKDKKIYTSIIKEKTKQMKAAIESISDEITELEKTKDEMQSLFFDLSALEEKYRIHMAEVKK